jgi:tetratricopeptide (TPR) repeat protein
VPAADELVELCARRGDEPSLAVALAKRALNASALGRPDAAFADLRRALVLAERHRVAPALMVVHLGLGVQHQARGEEEASEEHLRAAERVQATLTMAGSGLATSVRATALLAQGRLAGFEPRLREVHRAHPALRDLHALSVLAADGPAAAHALLGPWREQPPMIWDYLWVSAAALRGLLWSQLGVPEAVAGLRAQLEPYADRVADGANAAFFLGSVRHALGCLALAGGDHAAARRWAGEARDLHRRLGWAPWERLSAELLARVPPG